MEKDALIDCEKVSTGSIRIKANIRDEIESENFLIDRELIEEEHKNRDD